METMEIDDTTVVSGTAVATVAVAAPDSKVKTSSEKIGGGAVSSILPSAERSEGLVAEGVSASLLAAEPGAGLLNSSTEGGIGPGLGLSGSTEAKTYAKAEIEPEPETQAEQNATSRVPSPSVPPPQLLASALLLPLPLPIPLSPASASVATLATPAHTHVVSTPTPTPTPAPTLNFKERYIASLEEHCLASDSLRKKEAEAHTLDREVAALQHEVSTLQALLAKEQQQTQSVSLAKSSLKRSLESDSEIPLYQKKQPSQPFSRPAPPILSSSPLTPLSTPKNSSSQPFLQVTSSHQLKVDSSNYVPGVSTSLSTPSLAGPTKQEPSTPLNLSFKLPPPPDYFPSGARNVSGLRAWTDILRAKYPTFKRTSPAMSKSAKDFVTRRGNGNKHYIASITGERVSRPTHAVPERLIPEFVDFMEELYLRNGQFGEAGCHDFDMIG